MSDFVTKADLEALVEQHKKDLYVYVDNTKKDIIAKMQQQKITATNISAGPKEKPKVPTELVKVGKKSYKWKVARVNLGGDTGVITAEQAASDPEIVKRILAMEGQGMLVEQV